MQCFRQTPVSYSTHLPPEQEPDVAVLSVQDNMRQCHQVWQAACSALLHSTARNQHLADRQRTTALTYTLGQMVWVSSTDHPHQTDSYKLVPRYIGPFENDEI